MKPQTRLLMKCCFKQHEVANAYEVKCPKPNRNANLFALHAHSALHTFMRSTSLDNKHNYRCAYCLWWKQTGSNRRPSACKADALPAELCFQK